jgi:hypothetical protein
MRSIWRSGIRADDAMGFPEGTNRVAMLHRNAARVVIGRVTEQFATVPSGILIDRE